MLTMFDCYVVIFDPVDFIGHHSNSALAPFLLGKDRAPSN